MESLVFEEFERYSHYFNYERLRNKTFLITGAKGFLASATIRFLLYLNNKFDLNLYIYGTSRDTNTIPEYINKNDAIKYINFENFDKARLVSLSTVKNADQIIVVDGGKIVETGNHASLIEKKGAYYNLVKNQLELGN